MIKLFSFAADRWSSRVSLIQFYNTILQKVDNVLPCILIKYVIFVENCTKTDFFKSIANKT
ncbi:hypothetical protein MASR2M117_17940 [Paludibacter sp.]